MAMTIKPTETEDKDKPNPVPAKRSYDNEQYASKLDEIGNKLPNLVGDQNALIAYAAELKGLAQRVRNPEDVSPNPAGQPDVRPSHRDLHPDGQDEAMKPKYRLEHDPNAPQHLPIAKTNPATAAVYAEADRQANAGEIPKSAVHAAQPVKANTEQTVTDRTKFGTGSDTQKRAGKPGKL